MKIKHLPILTLAGLVLFSASASAATTLISDGFEGSLGNWTAASGATLYTYSGTGVNFATTGTGAVSVPLNTSSNPTLTLTNSLELVTLEATFVTIEFDFAFFQQNSGTRWFRIERSLNGGTNWTQLAQIASNTGLGTVDEDGVRRGTYTHTTSTGLTDEVMYRIFGKNDTSQNWVVYIDNMLITSDAIPEPTTALLGSLGMLALLRRRR